MREAVIQHIRNVFRAHADLVANLPPEMLGKDLGLPSNSLGEQFWCVVGARESYTRALLENGWAGFNCSLGAADVLDPQRVATALDISARQFEETVTGLEWTEARDGLLLDLLEHETQHQGQLIRYVYGLNQQFPESWVRRWNLKNK